MNEKIKKTLDFLDKHGIGYELHTHPPLPTIELALEYWKDLDAVHCKNLFSATIRETGTISLSSNATKSWQSMTWSILCIRANCHSPHRKGWKDASGFCLAQYHLSD